MRNVMGSVPMLFTLVYISLVSHLSLSQGGVSEQVLYGRRLQVPPILLREGPLWG